LILPLNRIYATIFFILFGTLSLAAQSNLVALHTSEFDQFRRIMVHIPQNNANILTLPAFRENPAAGKIQITIYNVAENRYLGPSVIKETGLYPVRIRVEFPQPETMQIAVETVPFQQLTAFNVFGSEQFIFDIYKIRPSETLMLEKSVSLFPGSGPDSEKTNLSDLEFSWTSRVRYFLLKHGSGRIMDALLYSGLIIATLALIGMIWQFSRKKKIALPRAAETRKPGKKRKKEVTPVSPAPAAVAQVTTTPEEPFIPLTPADKENMIRELMQKEGISYDEATILVSLSKGKLNVSV